LPKERFEHTLNLLIDLPDPEENQLFNLQPRALVEQISILKPEIEWIITDDIQKAPKLLDIVHQQIESTRFKLALTGSSARKLDPRRRQSACCSRLLLISVSTHGARDWRGVFKCFRA
jgi:uncharacterized protein